MHNIERLQAASTLTDLAKILNFTPSGLSYILYKTEPEQQYRTFEIPKKNGGVRIIQAPQQRLPLLQQRLSKLLYECIEDIVRRNPGFGRASHGFQSNRTIVSNAAAHTRHRYVFNVDIQDFFGSINFGRVRGFFIKDRSFALNPAVATVIAQIACYKNALPQGSPCSPVISNLIGNILDARLLSLARDARCTYTRYADDLTFSSNIQPFPTSIAINIHGSEWQVGDKLRREIERAGFRLNDTKTRMSLSRSRQVVTGLVVNSKPNINQDYYRFARSMCNSVFQTGQYFVPEHESAEISNNLNQLKGVLSFIYFVKARRDRSPKINKLGIIAGEFKLPRSYSELFRKFLFYKEFIAPTAPIIITEGLTDIIYLKCALHALSTKFPLLIKEENGRLVRKINFLQPTGTTRDIMKLGHGSAGQAELIPSYSNNTKKYMHKPMAYPVILLCDNDGGSKEIFKNCKSTAKITVSETTVDPFYYICENLYVIKVPEGKPAHAMEIEELFTTATLDELWHGKPFDRKKDHGDETAYGKSIFAKEIVRAKAASIDFSGFEELLSRIEQCITHHKTMGTTIVSPTGAVPAAAAP